MTERKKKTADSGDEPDIKSMTFEQALAALETIVSQLESGQVELAKSIAIYERGEQLRAHCDALLKQAEARIAQVTLQDGKVTGTASFADSAPDG